MAVQAGDGSVCHVRSGGSSPALRDGGPAQAAAGTTAQGTGPTEGKLKAMSTTIDRFDNKARDTFDHIGQNEVYVGELQRHRVYTRFLHWMVALFFFLAVFSGFGIYLPWL